MNDIDRDTLEKIALKTISAENYYDLADNLIDMNDDELLTIIEAKGDFAKELEFFGQNIKDYE